MDAQLQAQANLAMTVSSIRSNTTLFRLQDIINSIGENCSFLDFQQYDELENELREALQHLGTACNLLDEIVKNPVLDEVKAISCS